MVTFPITGAQFSYISDHRSTIQLHFRSPEHSSVTFPITEPPYNAMLHNSKLLKLSEQIRALEEKLQNAYNENAKLKVKHKEDKKHLTELESKFASTQNICDQLTETLQTLAYQVQDAENDKVFFTNKLSETSAELDNLHGQMKSLSLRVESSEETIRNQLMELGVDKENVHRQLRKEHCKVLNLVNEKDSLVKNFEETVACNESTVESLNSKLSKLELELISKDDRLKDMQELSEKKEKVNGDLRANDELMTVKLTDLDRQSLSFREKFVKLNDLFSSCFELVKEEQKLAILKAQQSFDSLHGQLLNVTSEKDSLHSANQELNKISEVQNDQKVTMAQHAEESHLAEEKAPRLESEAETLLSKKAEMDNQIIMLEDKIRSLSEASRLSEIQMQDFQLKHSESETATTESIRNLQSEIHGKEEEIDTLRKEIVKHEEHVDSLEKQLSQLHSSLQEKEQAQKMLAEAESNVAEAKKQFSHMLESKQLELSRHLKEISQRNDQAINDIRKKYEVEKQECIKLEKEKAEKAVVDMEKKWNQKLSESKEESKQQLMKIEGERTALINRIRQENDKKEANLKSMHCEELKKMQLRAENELKETTKLLQNQCEAELRELRSQHEEECRHLEEELTLQKEKRWYLSQEERQKALLQLQRKVMSDQPQEDQEVTSRKPAFIWQLLRSVLERAFSNTVFPFCRTYPLLDLPYEKATQLPVSNMLKKAEKGNPGSVLSIPKHSKKVTHHEYEVETSEGRTITKRRKTKSTIMFQDPKKNKRRTPKAVTPREAITLLVGKSKGFAQSRLRLKFRLMNKKKSNKIGFRAKKKSRIYLDGSFLFHCFIHKMDIRNINAIKKGMKFEIATTDCTWKELSCYVNQFTEHRIASIYISMKDQKVTTINCGHKDNMHAQDCIMSLVGGNENKALIASHDSYFLQKLSVNPFIRVVVIEGGAFALKCLSKNHRREYLCYREPEPAEERLLNRMKLYEFEHVKVTGDGNCLLRALSEQMTHDEHKHGRVRELLAGQIKGNEELYKELVQMFMAHHPELFGQQPTYSKFVQYFSKDGSMAPVFITLQAASDFFTAKIVCITSEEKAVFREFTPHDVDDPEIVWYLSVLATEEGHTDSVYPQRTPSKSCRHLYDLKTLSIAFFVFGHVRFIAHLCGSLVSTVVIPFHFPLPGAGTSDIASYEFWGFLSPVFLPFCSQAGKENSGMRTARCLRPNAFLSRAM
ncbi:myosin heavy chain-related protein [Artemisia annua]|uniref:Myosin heavy chain-related protein n=1 Tax=Artemisia annua TaxID=35608 RepID=A0A2U1QFA3_ARTAN|nr:myosin heavy chain-related protein [Artemisia annua]